MDDSETNYELSSSLLCDEDDSYLSEREREQEHEQDREREAHFVSEEEEDEYVENMFKRESLFFGFGSENRIRFEPAQSHALDWIFNTRVRLGFNFRTLYLSITYFDRFLSKRPIDREKVWAIRLLSVACLSVAAKIEECHVPMLPEFPVSGYGFFESKAIKRMELLVLTELEWKMGSLTPFSYLNYFIHKFASNEGISKELIISNSVELILAMTKENKSNQYCPCIVAASAVLLVSLDEELTRETIELKTNNVIKFWGSEDIENLCSCCDVLKEIERVRKVKTPPQELEISLNMVSLPNPHNSAAKRRLSFNESNDRSKNRRT